MEGWIKLSKKLLSWEWFDSSEMVHLFIYCLLKANFEPKKWHGIAIERGSFITSRAKISSETHLSEQEIRTCLKRLISTNEITYKSTKQFTLITICNYDSYQQENLSTNQAINQGSNQQLTNDQPTANQQLTTTKNNKNNKNNIYMGEKEKRKVFQIPNVEDIQSFILENSYSVDAERFFNFYESKGWLIGKNKMKDWKAAVRTWQRSNNSKNRNYGTENKPNNREDREREFAEHIVSKLGD